MAVPNGKFSSPVQAQNIPQVGSAEWFEWLSTNRKFKFHSQNGSFTAQRETRRNGDYWYAYRRSGGKLNKFYLGKSEHLSLQKLEQASAELSGSSLLNQFLDQPGSEKNFENKDQSRPVSPFSSVDVPLLPSIMISRPHLTKRISTPLTLIYAPSGFGKSTLLNEWRRSCPFPVAWLSLDRTDNHRIRFWSSVILAIQSMVPGLCSDLLALISSGMQLDAQQVTQRISRELNQVSPEYPHLGLVMDDFHRINHAQILDGLQLWLMNFPPNLQIVLSGHVKPPLALGDLRVRGKVIELDTMDLRFSNEEGINYLKQFSHTTTLGHSDLEKLTRHAEGWAAGLTLTGLALGKQQDHAHFMETFSGAHIYMREYFMETVLKGLPANVQEFLLKTALLKRLHGDLCDAVTGQTGGTELLEYLWNENIFIIKLEEKNWYRYHDLFAELLNSILETRYPNEIYSLHQRAARWFRERFSPAEAIHHFLAIQAWEEAASLMEETALRELEQYGEDSRLLRWLQELPEVVVQNHKRLLYVYLQLASIALPFPKVEKFVQTIGRNIRNKPASAWTTEEADVLQEIILIQKTWSEGNVFQPPSSVVGEQQTGWALLGELPMIIPDNKVGYDEYKNRLIATVQKAESQHNLFVMLMAGGNLSKLLFLNGELRASEKTGRQVLEYVLSARGKLPEPSSICLSILSLIALVRNQLQTAKKLHRQLLEVDPNPTSSNMVVYSGLLQSKIEMAEGKFDQARETLQALQVMHRRRPSGAYLNQDISVYEALVCIRQGDFSAARQILDQVENLNQDIFAQTVLTELLIRKKQPELAEIYLRNALSLFPARLQLETIQDINILLSIALFDQGKISPAIKLMAELLRKASPENLIQPFLERIEQCHTLLSMTLEVEHFQVETVIFAKELLANLPATDPSPAVYRDIPAALLPMLTISPREQEVLRLMSFGDSNREIAQKLSISESTVKTHIANIFSKLQVNNRVQAISQANKLNLL